MTFIQFSSSSQHRLDLWQGRTRGGGAGADPGFRGGGGGVRTFRRGGFLQEFQERIQIVAGSWANQQAKKKLQTAVGGGGGGGRRGPSNDPQKTPVSAHGGGGGAKGALSPPPPKLTPAGLNESCKD